MPDEIPAHRAGITPRSGDTHVIGAEGKAINVDAAARAKATKTTPAETPADPLDHDGDGRKGGSPAGEQATRTRGRTDR